MAVNKKSLENLKPINENVTKEQKKEAGKKGGKKSGEIRRKKKEMKELVNDILNMTVSDGKVEDFKNLAESKGKNITVEQAIILAQVKSAIQGSVKSAIFLRDTAGEKPVDKQEITADVTNQGKLNDIFEALKK